MHTTVVISRE